MPHNNGDGQPMVLLRRLAPEQIDRFSGRRRRPQHYMGNSISKVNGEVHSDGTSPLANGHDRDGQIECAEKNSKVNGHDNSVVDKPYQMAHHSKSTSANTVGATSKRRTSTVFANNGTAIALAANTAVSPNVKGNEEAIKENSNVDRKTSGASKVVPSRPRGRPPRNRAVETVKSNVGANTKCNGLVKQVSPTVVHTTVEKTQECELALTSRKRKHSAEDLKDNTTPVKRAIILEKEPEKGEYYGFLAGYSSLLHPRLESLYLHSYWPANWAYSAQSLTGHVLKKTTKESLRKIRQIMSNSSNVGSIVSKSSINYAPCLTTAASTSALSANSTSVQSKKNEEVKPHPATRRGRRKKIVSDNVQDTETRKKQGRPPGARNKHLAGVLKDISPRKSPRQHASTLAAKATKAKVTTVDESDVVNLTYEEESPLPPVLDAPIEITHNAQRQRNRKSGLSANRHSGPRRRTPPPPKLCAQQNDKSGEVKLRTKHVDVVRRKVRDERIRNIMQTKQLASIREIAEKNRREFAMEFQQYNDVDEENSNPCIVLPPCEHKEWNTSFDVKGLNNMCAQIMYEQSADKRYLLQALPQDLLKVLQRSITVAKSRRVGDDCYITDCNATINSIDPRKRRNKYSRKKKQNMTGWPKEKRRKAPAQASENVSEEDDQVEEKTKSTVKRRTSAVVQKQSRKRLKLQQASATTSQRRQKRKSGGPAVTPGPKKGRPFKKTVAVENANPKRSPQKKLVISETLAADELKSVPVQPRRTPGRPRGTPGRPRGSPGRPKGSPGRPKGTPGRPKGTPGRPRGSVGRQRRRLKKLHYDSDTDSPSNHHRSVLPRKQRVKLVIKRNKRPETTVSQYHLTRRRKQLAASNVWDEGRGRPKRYKVSSAVEEAFVGSQPFEQHCPSDPCAILSTVEDDT
ncbi:uncharacterized protein LOC126837461 [Adelges cooleyi]|uniref:uncharacterized protein LOC126837461 n=1 Tax=Adelges cooleyi TaxID=133065 RepID=UPI00217FEA1B|nr:uncharacterized protein LOC126837461 [Adelges cooleyi]